MFYDCHMHSAFSSDSKMLLTDAIQRASELNLGLCLTEHFDYNYLNLDYHEQDMDFRFDREAYFREYEQYRSREVLLGVEVGLADENKAANLEFIKDMPFDMVIGSVHTLENHDLYYPGFYEGKTKDEIVEIYFSEMNRLLKENCHYIDVLGHIDYIFRYLPGEDKLINYPRYKGLIDKVLRTAIEHNVILELNTRRFDKKENIQDLYPIYDRYHQMDAVYITLGSDAHSVDAIGMHFPKALDFMHEIGLHALMFKERRNYDCFAHANLY